MPRELPTSLCQMESLMRYPVDISRTSVKVTYMVTPCLVPSKDHLIENLQNRISEVLKANTTIAQRKSSSTSLVSPERAVLPA